MVRYQGSLSAYVNLAPPKGLRRAPRVEVLWGAPGVGKSRYVHDFANVHFGLGDFGTFEPDLWTSKSSQWFDGYSGQRVALFDDYAGGIEFQLFVKLLDRYHLQVPVKGGFTWWYPDWIFITSNVDPENWYSDLSPNQLGALLRRIRVYHVTEPLEFGRMSFY